MGIKDIYLSLWSNTMSGFNIYETVEENRLRALLHSKDKNNTALKKLYVSSSSAISAYWISLNNLR